MWPWILRVAVVFLILTLSYVALSAYRRWDRRKSLEAAYDAAGPTGLSRDAFIAAGMTAYDRSLRKRLLLGVYLLPVLTVAILIALAQIG